MAAPTPYGFGIYGFGFYGAVTVDDQEQLSNRSSISPLFLVDITSVSGSLHFCNDRAVTYLGQLYQPYLSSAGTLRTAASFPQNSTRSEPTAPVQQRSD